MVMPQTDSALLFVGQSWLFVLLRHSHYNHYVAKSLFCGYVCFSVHFVPLKNFRRLACRALCLMALAYGSRSTGRLNMAVLHRLVATVAFGVINCIKSVELA